MTRLASGIKVRAGLAIAVAVCVSASAGLLPAFESQVWAKRLNRHAAAWHPQAGEVVRYSEDGGSELSWKVVQHLPNGEGLLIRRGDDMAMVAESDVRPGG